MDPRILKLFEIIQQQADAIEKLGEEISRLKGHKGKPKLRPSGMEQKAGKKKKRKGKGRGGAKRSKTPELEIHETQKLHPDEIPEGSKFKGYKDYVVQDIVIRAHNIRMRLGRWLTPSGEWITAQLPVDIKGHFGATLK